MFWHNFLQIDEQYIFYDLKEATMNKVIIVLCNSTLTTLIREKLSNNHYHQCQHN